jgi:Tfp pilus assembly protein FimV
VVLHNLIGLKPLGDEAQEDFQQAHLELNRVYEQLGDRGKAREVAQQLLDRWNGADADVVLLAETQALVKRLSAGR